MSKSAVFACFLVFSVIRGVEVWCSESLAPRGPKIYVFQLFLQVLNYLHLLFATCPLRGVEKWRFRDISVYFGVFGCSRGGGWVSRVLRFEGV